MVAITPVGRAPLAILGVRGERDGEGRHASASEERVSRTDASAERERTGKRKKSCAAASEPSAHAAKLPELLAVIDGFSLPLSPTRRTASARVVLILTELGLCSSSPARADIFVRAVRVRAPGVSEREPACGFRALRTRTRRSTRAPCARGLWRPRRLPVWPRRRTLFKLLTGASSVSGTPVCPPNWGSPAVVFRQGTLPKRGTLCQFPQVAV